jgi:hypothetical protein
MKYLTLSIPGMNGTPITSNLPSGVPTGGFDFDKTTGIYSGTGVSIISTLLILIVVLSVIYTLWNVWLGGWQLILSRGVKEKVKNARNRILSALLGLIFLILCFLVVGVLNAFFNTNMFPFLKFR